MWMEYVNAGSIEQTLTIIGHPNNRAKLVAGATDLMLEIERGQHRDVHTLVDISRIDGLNRIQLDGQGNIHIGALVTHNDCVISPTLRQFALPLVLACWEVGSPQIRNRGTVVGNLVTASPANDTITPLLALDASLVVRSLRGIRRIPLSEFYRGVRATRIEPDEMVLEIVIRKMQSNERGMFIKSALRQAQAISIANTAVILEIDAQIVRRARIALGAVAPIVVRADEAENYLIGKTLDEDVIQQAARLAVEAAQPISDIRGSKEYRQWIIQVITRRALHAIRQDNQASKLPEKPATLRITPVKKLPPQAQSGITTVINGRLYQFNEIKAKSLLDFIREDVGLTGTKEGCAEGECGACTVFLDGMAVMSCLVPAGRANGAEIITIEGLGTSESLHPVQQAFVEAGAVQCGYCTPGLVMSSAKLLQEISKPTKNQITQALTGNLCRCTGYYKIIEAVEKAAGGG